MKRIKSACIDQTICFEPKDGISGDAAGLAVREEIEHYKKLLDGNRVKYKIVDEALQPDGSMVLKIKKQFNNHNCGTYLD